MIELPRALAPWAPLLALFAPELGPTFGAWVQRLSLAFGPLRVRGSEQGGEPDGFDGIGRRGLYERLLASEWLLATEAPDEFLRRAANGEHAFLQVARSEPSGSRVSVALCDAGPSQIGAPRIAHLAALVALAQRAEAAGAVFRWGVLQQSDRGPHEELTRASLAILLAARTAHEVSSGDIEAALEASGARGRPDELWFIGGRAMAREAALRGASALELTEEVDPGQRRLGARVIPSSGGPRELSLELPPPAMAARLLRDPFSIAAVAPRRALPAHEISPDATLFFSPNGRRLLVRLGDNGVIAYPLANSPRATVPGKPVVFRSRDDALLSAAGWVGNHLVVLCETASTYRLQMLGKRGGGIGEALVFARPAGEAPRPGPLRQFFRLSFGSARGIQLFQDSLGRLVQLSAGGVCKVLCEEILGVAQIDWGVRVALRSDEGAGKRVRIEVYPDKGGCVTLPFTLPDTTQPVHFGYGGWGSQADGGVAAVAQGAERWSLIVANLAALEVDVPLATPVVGVMGATSADHGPGLLLLSRDERSLDQTSSPGLRVLTAASPITRVAVATSAMLVAYITCEGELVVHSLPHASALLRVLRGQIAG